MHTLLSPMLSPEVASSLRYLSSRGRPCLVNAVYRNTFDDPRLHNLRAPKGSILHMVRKGIYAFLIDVKRSKIALLFTPYVLSEGELPELCI